MNNYHDPHAEICNVAFADLKKVNLITMMGASDAIIETSGEAPTSYQPQSANFTERQNNCGEYVEQEFEAVFTDSNDDAISKWRNITQSDTLVLISFTNGVTLVAGTTLAPVRCAVEQGATPRTTKISFKRLSPEFAKVLKSFE